MASAYAAKMRSRPRVSPGAAKALTSINKVEQGRWKLVSSVSTARKVCGGRMKRRVRPAGTGSRIPAEEAALSTARSEVVPTATTRCPSRRARRTASAEVGPIDRKSTRLNSSHGYISYAVFCLKKKKTEITTHEAKLHS